MTGATLRVCAEFPQDPVRAHLSIPPSVLIAFCQKHGIRRLSLFGSTLKGTARPDSDVDLLVEFAEGQKPGLFALAGMENELSDLVGRRADMRTAEELSRYFRDDVVRTAQVQYDGG